MFCKADAMATWKGAEIESMLPSLQKNTEELLGGKEI